MIIKEGLYSKAEVDAAQPDYVGTRRGYPFVNCMRHVYFGFDSTQRLVTYKELYAFRHAERAAFRQCFTSIAALADPSER